MRHRSKTRRFGRKTTAWKALFRGLIISIVEHGRITTTVEKAKELRKHVERAITLGKKNDLAARRLLLSRIPHQDTVRAIMSDIAPRFKNREGGYTRIIKIGRRPGDTAEMAFIEFVDYDWENPSQGKASSDASEKSEKPAKAGKKAAAGEKAAKKAPAVKKSSGLVAKKKAGAKKLQKKSRAAARA